MLLTDSRNVLQNILNNITNYSYTKKNTHQGISQFLPIIILYMNSTYVIDSLSTAQEFRKDNQNQKRKQSLLFTDLTGFQIALYFTVRLLLLLVLLVSLMVGF